MASNANTTPLRHEQLAGMGATKHIAAPGAVIGIGLAALAYFNKGKNWQKTTLKTGGAFLAGWLLGGYAQQY
jgi:hypothetical protein